MVGYFLGSGAGNQPGGAGRAFRTGRRPTRLPWMPVPFLPSAIAVMSAQRRRAGLQVGDLVRESSHPTQVGRFVVNSQVLKKVSRSFPGFCALARAMNCSVVTRPPALFRVQVRNRSTNLSFP